MLESKVAEYQALTLNLDQQKEYAEMAIGLRWDKDEKGLYPVDPSQLLKQRRSADEGNSLWKIFNKVQENLVKGGQRPTGRLGRRTRKVTSAIADHKLNRDLWNLTEHIANAPCFAK